MGRIAATDPNDNAHGPWDVPNAQDNGTTDITMAMFTEDTCSCAQEFFRVTATERDPYYIDELARELDTPNMGLRTIHIDLGGRVCPLVRNLNIKNVVIPGYDGIPKNKLRADLELYTLGTFPVNVMASIPKMNNTTRQVSLFERDKNKWIIITYDMAQYGERGPTPRQTAAYPIRGRGNSPWWRTGRPGEKTSGIG